MWIQIGKKPAAHTGYLENLFDCHDRIRHFTGLAIRLAEVRGLTEEEIRSTAASVARYFRESLPLHVKDEEESLLPRLRGKEKALDEALERMSREHQGHEPLIAELLDIMETMAAEPCSWHEKRERLSVLGAALEEEFRVHLQQEEQVIFPAIERLLDASQGAEIRDEIGLRRGQDV